MNYTQLRRYKYLLILVLIALSALFFNYVFVYAAFVTNADSGFSVEYDASIPFTASNVNTKLKAINNLTDIVFDYDNGEKYESIKTNNNGVSTHIVEFKTEDGAIISTYVHPLSAEETYVYFLSETDIIVPISCESIFKNLTTLKSITFNNFNTSKVKNMKSMFESSGLTSLDLSSFDTSSVTNMSRMFYSCKALTSLDLSSFITGNAENMSNLFSWCSALTSLNLDSFNTINVTNMSSMFSQCSSLMILDLSSFETSNVTDMSGMFFNCNKLTSLSSFDTSSVTTMSDMFRDCSNLTSLDLSSFDTSNVTTMSQMFYYCSGLTSLDLSSFNTSNVNNMSYMFYGCSGLTSLDLSNFDTSKVTGMYSMFSGCSGLTSLDLSNFNTGNVTSISNMFSSCSSLTSLIFGENFNASKAESLIHMFSGCSSLTSLDLTSFDTDNLKEMNYMFSGCSSLTSLDLSSFNTSNVTSMHRMFQNSSSLKSLDLSSFNTNKVQDMYYMFYNCSALTTIYVSDSWSTSAVTSSTSMFYGCSKLVGGAGTTYNSSYKDKTYARIDQGDYSKGYLTNIKALNYGKTFAKLLKNSTSEGTSDSTIEKITFDYTAKVSSSTLSGVEPEQITPRIKLYRVNSGKEIYILSDEKIYTSAYAGYMFKNLKSLTEINFNNFDTSTARYMTHMFLGCSALPKLDVTGFNVKNVLNMPSIFHTLTSLTELDLSTWSTDSLVQTDYMFKDCSGLTSLDLSGFDTEDVTTMSYMFNGCTGLTSLDLSGLDTRNVKSMNCMFSGCVGLTSLNLGGDFDTSSVTNMYLMFGDCSNLVTLDISNFKTNNVTNMQFMFDGCTKLNILCVDKDNWKVDKVTTSDAMFKECNVLAGNGGTCYDYNYTNDLAYANIDGGISDPGYLTDITKTEQILKSNAGGIKQHLINVTGEVVFDYYSSYPEFRTNATGINVDVFETGSIKFYSVSNANTGLIDGYILSENEIFANGYCYDLFGHCKMLNIVFNNFNTKNVGKMGSMFGYCSNLTKLDLSSFDTSQVQKTEYMFIKCEYLKTIYVNKDNWNFKNVTYSYSMFDYCTRLVGGAGTKYKSSNPKDITYACIDGGTSAPGYFTGDATLASGQEFNKLIKTAPSHESQNLTIQKIVFDKYSDTYSTIVKGVTPVYVAADGSTAVKMYRVLNGSYYDVYILSYLDIYAPVDSSYMFYYLTDLTSILFNNFNTSKVENMSSMFDDCWGLKSLDVSKFNTSNVTDMSQMFSGLTLTSLDLSNFVTNNVTNMYRMFNISRALAELNLSSFDTSKVTNMGEMFYLCEAIKILDLSSFDTCKVTDMGKMFMLCSKLTAICVGEGWETSQVTTSANMFYESYRLVGGEGTEYNSSYVDKTYARIDEGNYTPGYLTDVKMTKVLKSYSDGLLDHLTSEITGKIVFDYYSTYPSFRDNTDGISVDVNNLGTIKLYYVTNNNSAVDCYILSEKEIFAPSSCDNLFANCSEVMYIYFNNFNTSNVNSMTGMFLNCYELMDLDLRNFDTSSVYSMASMFENCENLTELDLRSFDTSVVESMNSMFYSCSGLISLDLSSFNIYSVNDMQYMFQHCQSLEVLDISSFNTFRSDGREIDYYCMFNDCSNLTTIYAAKGMVNEEDGTCDIFINWAPPIREFYNDYSEYTYPYLGTYTMFSNCNNLKGYDIDSTTNDYNIKGAWFAGLNYYDYNGGVHEGVGRFKIKFEDEHGNTWEFDTLEWATMWTCYIYFDNGNLEMGYFY